MDRPVPAGPFWSPQLGRSPRPSPSIHPAQSYHRSRGGRWSRRRLHRPAALSWLHRPVRSRPPPAGGGTTPVVTAGDAGRPHSCRSVRRRPPDRPLSPGPRVRLQLSGNFYQDHVGPDLLPGYAQVVSPAEDPQEPPGAWEDDRRAPARHRRCCPTVCRRWRLLRPGFPDPGSHHLPHLLALRIWVRERGVPAGRRCPHPPSWPGSAGKPPSSPSGTSTRPGSACRVVPPTAQARRQLDPGPWHQMPGSIPSVDNRIWNPTPRTLSS